jgi:hypothetical protein
MVMKGVPEHIRSDNGPEFVAKDLRKINALHQQSNRYKRSGTPVKSSLI